MPLEGNSKNIGVPHFISAPKNLTTELTDQANAENKAFSTLLNVLNEDSVNCLVLTNLLDFVVLWTLGKQKLVSPKREPALPSQDLHHPNRES